MIINSIYAFNIWLRVSFLCLRILFKKFIRNSRLFFHRTNEEYIVGLVEISMWFYREKVMSSSSFYFTRVNKENQAEIYLNVLEIYIDQWNKVFLFIRLTDFCPFFFVWSIKRIIEISSNAFELTRELSADLMTFPFEEVN